MSGRTSLNFAFLAVHDPKLVEVAGQAERLFAEDPNASLMKLRLFGELLAQRVAAAAGVFVQVDENQASLLGRLRARNVVAPDVADLFHTIRKAGNAASHQGQGDHRTALTLLRTARELGIWFHRASGAAKTFAPGPFVPPPDPRGETQALAEELARLRKELSQVEGAKQAASMLAEHEAELRELAEAEAAKALSERDQWEQLALLTDAEKASAEAQLRALQEQRAAAPQEVQQFKDRGELATEKLVLDEHQTRLLIDQQLRDAGWEADTERLRYAAGTRPEAHRNLAIAEWPTKKGPADKEAFDKVYGPIDDDLVQKITGKSDKPSQRIRTFKNEHAPTVAVTVDLLTTGIDVPAVCNIVFLRRVKSRILYDQMLGRATRRCDEIGKAVFRVFDAVDLYAALSAVSDMKPVVVDPKVSFYDLLNELAQSPELTRSERLLEQLLVKLRAKGRAHVRRHARALSRAHRHRSQELCRQAASRRRRGRPHLARHFAQPGAASGQHQGPGGTLRSLHPRRRVSRRDPRLWRGRAPRRLPRRVRPLRAREHEQAARARGRDPAPARAHPRPAP